MRLNDKKKTAQKNKSDIYKNHIITVLQDNIV